MQIRPNSTAQPFHANCPTLLIPSTFNRSQGVPACLGSAAPKPQDHGLTHVSACMQVAELPIPQMRTSHRTPPAADLRTIPRGSPLGKISPSAPTAAPTTLPPLPSRLLIEKASEHVLALNLLHRGTSDQG